MENNSKGELETGDKEHSGRKVRRGKKTRQKDDSIHDRDNKRRISHMFEMIPYLRLGTTQSGQVFGIMRHGD